jgi:hypothetical protein
MSLSTVKPVKPVKRSRTRRAGESAYGLLLLTKNALMALVALLLLVAGVWTSWGSAQHAMLASSREQGTMTVRSCGSDRCTGPFVPVEGKGSVRPRVSLDKSVAEKPGERYSIAIKPGTDEVVRTGPAGILYSWVPLAGAMVLAALVVAGGLRMRRTGWVLGLLGLAVMGAAFFAL